MSNIKPYIHLAVDIPLADPTNKLMIEPGTNGFIVLSNGAFKVGVNEELLLEAIRELNWLKIKHSYPKEENKEPEPVMGTIIEGDDTTDIPF